MSYQILIVDDDVDFRAELSDYLSQYRILEASSGDEALKIIKKPHVVDLVILDVVMPGTDGIEILKEIKRIVPDLGIMILTGKDSKDIIVDALRGNADDFFEKPIDLPRLDAAIERILSRKKASLATSAVGKDDKIKRIKIFMERNHDKMVNLKDLAAEVCLSPKYLSRVFKEDVGVGFKDYQLKIRMEKAQVLLKDASYSIHQISDNVGYKNVESFIRLFRKSTGTTPTSYREKHKNKAKGRNGK